MEREYKFDQDYFVNHYFELFDSFEERTDPFEIHMFFVLVSQMGSEVVRGIQFGDLDIENIEFLKDFVRSNMQDKEQTYIDILTTDKFTPTIW